MYSMVNKLYSAVEFYQPVEYLDDLIHNQGVDERTLGGVGFTPLRLAQILNRREQFTFLSNTPNAPINVKDCRGCTPLWHAADNEDYMFVKVLLRAGCNPFTQDRRGRTSRRLLENRKDGIVSREAPDCINMLRFVEDHVMELISAEQTNRAANTLQLMMMSRHERGTESPLRMLPNEILELISEESARRTFQDIEHIRNDTMSVFVKKVMIVYDSTR